MKPRYFYMFLILVFIFCIYTTAGFAEGEYVPLTCEERLKSLEPPVPRIIYDYEELPDRDMRNFKKQTFPISLVQKEGSSIPFVIVYKDLNWKRPAYHPNWHSSSWRWDYVPSNMANQQHIIFSYQMGLSWWYDLSNSLALPDSAGVPSPINEYAFTVKYPYIVRLIVFNFNIKSIKYYKNQIVVFGEPLRSGLTVVDFDTKNLPDSKKLVQLATPDGYELDYLILNFTKD